MLWQSWADVFIRTVPQTHITRNCAQFPSAKHNFLVEPQKGFWGQTKTKNITIFPIRCIPVTFNWAYLCSTLTVGIKRLKPSLFSGKFILPAQRWIVVETRGLMGSIGRDIRDRQNTQTKPLHSLAWLIFDRGPENMADLPLPVVSAIM